MTNKNLIKHNQQVWLKKHEAELIRAELNLCKMLSIWDTSKSKRKSKVIEQKETLPDGSIKIKRVSVGRIGKNEAGIFTIKKHFKTILALLKISEEQGNPEVCQFGVHKLAEHLNLKWSGRTYNYLKEAILDLEGIPITFENIFYNKETGEKEEVIARFRWLDELRVFGRLKNKQPNLAISTFRLNKYIRQNILKNYTKPLFLTAITAFKTEIAVLLYNHIDLVMADKNCYERTLKNLIEVDFRLDGKYKYAGDRKILFNKPLKELKGIKLSTGILNDIHLEKTKDDKDYKIVCRKSLPVISTITQEGIGELPAATTTQTQALVVYFHTCLDPQKADYQPAKKELQQAKELLAQHGTEKTKEIIKYALKKAPETNYKMRWFGAVLDYEREAINQLEKEQASKKQRQTRAKQEEKERKIKAEYIQYREQIIENYKAGLPADKLEENYKAVEKHLYQEFPYWQGRAKDHSVIHGTVEANLDNWLIEQGKVKVLDFDDWLGERGATL